MDGLSSLEEILEENWLDAVYAEPLYEKGFLSWEEDWVQGNPVKKYKETAALRLSWGEIGREDT